MPRWTELAAEGWGPIETAAYDGTTEPEEIRRKQLDAVARAAFAHLRSYGNCCQSTLWALQTSLGFGDARACAAGPPPRWPVASQNAVRRADVYWAR